MSSSGNSVAPAFRAGTIAPQELVRDRLVGGAAHSAAIGAGVVERAGSGNPDVILAAGLRVVVILDRVEDFTVFPAGFYVPTDFDTIKKAFFG